MAPLIGAPVSQNVIVPLRVPIAGGVHSLNLKLPILVCHGTVLAAVPFTW